MQVEITVHVYNLIIFLTQCIYFSHSFCGFFALEYYKLHNPLIIITQSYCTINDLNAILMFLFYVHIVSYLVNKLEIRGYTYLQLNVNTCSGYTYLQLNVNTCKKNQLIQIIIITIII